MTRSPIAPRLATNMIKFIRPDLESRAMLRPTVPPCPGPACWPRKPEFGGAGAQS